jgi:predicted RNA-binding Zn ribbon-like protein
METLCLQFMNSEFRDFRGRWVRDDLQQPGWLEQWLSRWQLQVEAPPDATVIASLVTLRTRLQHIVATLTDGQINEDDLEQLRAILLNVPIKRTVVKDEQGYHVAFLPLKRDWQWVQAEIVASFVQLLAEHDPRRLKVCANPHCRWIFYDDSKSRTRRYCTPDKCANLWKARRFRQRHAKGTAEEHP